MGLFRKMFGGKLSKEDTYANKPFKDVGLDEMISARSSMGVTNDNFTIITRMITTYYMMLSSQEYANRFPTKKVLFTTIGVLDAQIYVFQEKSISIEKIKQLADEALRKNNPLLEFTIAMGIIISKVDSPKFTLREIKDAWEGERSRILEVLTSTQKSYPSGSQEEDVAKGHTEMFLNIPQTLEVRKQIGII